VLAAVPAFVAKLRQPSGCCAQASSLVDVVLPDDVETISFFAPDDDGQIVEFEALPPERRIQLVFDAVGDD
jgi:hypothetical protein